MHFTFANRVFETVLIYVFFNAKGFDSQEALCVLDTNHNFLTCNI